MERKTTKLPPLSMPNREGDKSPPLRRGDAPGESFDAKRPSGVGILGRDRLSTGLGSRVSEGSVGSTVPSTKASRQVSTPVRAKYDVGGLPSPEALEDYADQLQKRERSEKKHPQEVSFRKSDTGALGVRTAQGTGFLPPLGKGAVTAMPMDREISKKSARPRPGSSGDNDF